MLPHCLACGALYSLAMKEESMASLLKGQVEIDATYVGGKPRKGTGNKSVGRGTKKASVLALVERDGHARLMPIKLADAKT